MTSETSISILTQILEWFTSGRGLKTNQRLLENLLFSAFDLLFSTVNIV